LGSFNYILHLDQQLTGAAIDTASRLILLSSTKYWNRIDVDRAPPSALLIGRLPADHHTVCCLDLIA
jgi:hypothetical protein